jgi:phosphocarrier protein HPr
MKSRGIQGDGPRRLAGAGDESHPEGASPATAVVQVTIEVTDPSGLHLRAAGRFALTACRYQAQIWILHHDGRRDAKSILDVLTAAAGCGTQLLLEATGPDAEEAIRALSGLDPICKAV